MGIRIGITDGDREFFERFHAAFKEQFGNEFEVYLFPNLKKAIRAVELFRVQVVLLETPENGVLELPPEGLPKTAYFARLCDRKSEEKAWEHREQVLMKDPVDDIPLLCRFRSAEEWRELFLREVSSLPESVRKAAVMGATGGGAPGNQTESHVVLFTAAAGGVGTSTAAMGFANTCLRHHRHVLYLDLQTFPNRHGTPGDDLYTLEDILLSLRGVRYAPDAVLERTIRLDESGLGTILPPANPGNLFHMTGEEIVTMVDLIRDTGRFSIIVLDLGFDASERTILPLLRADLAVLVSNGSQIANRKTEQLLDTLPSLCTEDPLVLYEKTCLLYNRFRRGKSDVLKTENCYKLGGIGELDIPDEEDLLSELSVAPAMARLYEALIQRGDPHGPGVE